MRDLQESWDLHARFPCQQGPVQLQTVALVQFVPLPGVARAPLWDGHWLDGTLMSCQADVWRQHVAENAVLAQTQNFQAEAPLQAQVCQAVVSSAQMLAEQSELQAEGPYQLHDWWRVACQLHHVLPLKQTLGYEPAEILRPLNGSTWPVQLH